MTKPCPLCDGVGTVDAKSGVIGSLIGLIDRWMRAPEGAPPCHARDESTPLTAAEKREVERLVALVEAEHRVRDAGREDGRPPKPEPGVP